MIGPIDQGGRSVPCDYPLYCIAASSDGCHVVSCELLRTTHWQSEASRTIWGKVLNEISSPATDSSFGPLMCGAFPMPVMRGDDFYGLFRSRFMLTLRHKSTKELLPREDDYLRAEAEVRADVEGEWRAGLKAVLNALDPEIRTLILDRPDLGIVTVSRLLSQVRSHAPSSFSYVLQALRTESLGLLRLAATNPADTPEAQTVLDAILHGKSLPKALMQLGITKATHRKSVRPPNWPQKKKSNTVSNLFNMRVPGVTWLRLMRLFGSNPPQSCTDSLALHACLETVNSVAGLSLSIWDKWVRWCIQAGFKYCAMRASVIKRHAASMANAAGKLTQNHIDMNLCLSSVLAFAEALDAEHCKSENALSRNLNGESFESGLDIAILCSGKTADQLMQPIFDSHPGLSIGALHPIHGYTFHPIRTYDHLKSHGRTCHICIQRTDMLISYLARGCAFYAVNNTLGIVGTLALFPSHDELGNSEIQVSEISGLSNTRPSARLAHAANEIALAWSVDEFQSAWLTYLDACLQLI